MALIQLRKVVKTYTRGGETLRVLDQLDLDMEAGGFYALMGPSGSGKTTLLNLIGGLDRADEGQIVIDGEDIAAMRGPELADWRAEKVGFVPGLQPDPSAHGARECGAAVAAHQALSVAAPRTCPDSTGVGGLG